MLGSSEYARNMRATQSGVNDQSARRRRQHQVTPEEAEARWEQAKKDHMIPFHKMALLTMAATAPAFIMVFMYTEPDVGWHWAVKRPYPPIYDVEEPIILGKEQCAAFRRSTSDFRRAAPAGLPSSGAVYLWKLLRLNCLMPHECFERERGFDDDDDRITRLSNAENELTRQNCAPFLTQPPWGRHAFHGSSRVLEKHRRVNRTEVLPVAVAKDPWTWFRSACRRPAGMRFKRGETCPSPPGPVRFEERPWESLGHLWGAWHASYIGTRSIMVRYEDLLWRPVETVGAVCSCVGGMTAPPRDFDPILDSYGRGLSRIGNLRRYGNESLRFSRLSSADVERLAAPELKRVAARLGYSVNMS